MANLLGSKVTDKITGFTGVVTGQANYISGCSQCLVAPPVTKEGAFAESQWFDEQRLEASADPKVILDNGQTPGADKAAPKR